MFIPTHVIFCETTCDQMMKNDFPLCKFLLVETINTGAKHLPEHHGFSYRPLLDLENH
jgi:hypothetical protein